jgi:hypothetical protein
MTSSAEVVANEFVMLDSKPAEEKAPLFQPAEAPAMDDGAEDIPF